MQRNRFLNTHNFSLVKDTNDFMNRVKKLPRAWQKRILKEGYSLATAEALQKIILLTPSERASEFDRLLDFFKIETNCAKLIKTKAGEELLAQGDITFEEISEIKDKTHLAVILGPSAIKARKEQLISFDQMLKFKPLALDNLLKENGLAALREGLLTVDEALAMPNEDYLSFYNNKLLIAFRKKLINGKQIAALPTEDHLTALLYYPQVLEEGLITAQDAALMPDCRFIHALFCEPNGYTALREKLFRAKEAADFKSYKHVLECLKDKSLELLREKIITLKELTPISSLTVLKLLIENDNLVRGKILEPKDVYNITTAEEFAQKVAEKECSNHCSFTKRF